MTLSAFCFVLTLCRCIIFKFIVVVDNVGDRRYMSVQYCAILLTSQRCTHHDETWSISVGHRPRNQCSLDHLEYQLVQLTSDVARPDAHRFYERLGFTASHVGFKLQL